MATATQNIQSVISFAEQWGNENAPCDAQGRALCDVRSEGVFYDGLLFVNVWLYTRSGGDLCEYACISVQPDGTVDIDGRPFTTITNPQEAQVALQNALIHEFGEIEEDEKTNALERGF